MFVAEIVLLLLVISLTGYIDMKFDSSNAADMPVEIHIDRVTLNTTVLRLQDLAVKRPIT